ncbi:MAG: phage integrase N-terminal SAM-like domain-containing protein, partial [Chloroflexi bacterium]|nr:phage integrase N-terminal SAM-like domain-containing protein [Chloroflexota bacterium]
MKPASTIIARGDVVGNITSFRRHLAAANRSPRTIKTYLEAAHLLAGYLTEYGMPADVAMVRREHVESFVEDQLKRWTPNTAANRYRSLQQFFKFLVDEGEIKNSPMDKMKPPRQPEVLT